VGEAISVASSNERSVTFNVSRSTSIHAAVVVVVVVTDNDEAFTRATVSSSVV